MFEKATRLKLRFNTPLGILSTEDLWDLPLEQVPGSLDNLAKNLNKTIKEEDEESFVTKKTVTDTILHLKFEIVKHVINVKLEERDERKKALETKAKREKIMALIEEKQDDELKGKDLEELRALLKEEA